MSGIDRDGRGFRSELRRAHRAGAVTADMDRKDVLGTVCGQFPVRFNEIPRRGLRRAHGGTQGDSLIEVIDVEMRLRVALAVE